MTSEFRIDRPGVYVDRYGRRIQIWCNPGCTDTRYQWISIGDYCGFTYSDDGRRNYGMRSSGDIVAYVGALPAEILQRMAEALWAAECRPESTRAMTVGEALTALAAAKAQLQEEPPQ